MVSKQCFIAAVKGIASAEQVHWVEVPDQPVLEDVGTSPEEKSTEELVTVYITDGDLERFFLIGSSLSAEWRARYFAFLMANIEVFAWIPKEMPGVDPSFIQHELGVRPGSKPVV